MAAEDSVMWGHGRKCGRPQKLRTAGKRRLPWCPEGHDPAGPCGHRTSRTARVRVCRLSPSVRVNLLQRP